jgi:hypothetical protein
LLSFLLAACGPAEYLPRLEPPLHPSGTVPAWEPVSARPAATERPAENSLLSGEPCAPPCWQALEPGLTSAEEVRVFLDSSPYVADWQAQTLANGDVVYRWRWAPPTAALSPNEMRTRAGLLLSITLRPDAPLVLQQVIGAFGAPERVDLRAEPAEGDPTGRALDLYYPQRGLRLTVGGLDLSEDGTEVCPQRLAPVETVVYLEPGSIEKVVEEVYDVPPERVDVLARLRDWDGFLCLPVP